MIRVMREEDAAVVRALRLRALRDAPDAFLGGYEDEAVEPEAATAERLRANTRQRTPPC
jgi:hypothetical protein